MARQVVFDTETTGLSAENGDRILEIGCVELLHRKLTGRRLHLYINPERESEEGALRVHGLTTEFLSDKPKFAEVADQILDFMRDAEIIIHNAAFDVGFINKELELLGRPPFTTYVSGIIDTLAMAKEMFPGKRNSLDALCDRLDVDNSGRTLHGALLDAELLADRLGQHAHGRGDLVLVVVVAQEVDHLPVVVGQLDLLFLGQVAESELIDVQEEGMEEAHEIEKGLEEQAQREGAKA